MKITIIYFSLSGRTKALSQFLAEYLRTEGFSVAINPLKAPTGSFIKNCLDAITKKNVKLEYIPDIKHSDVIFLGSPVWAFDITPAMRTFLNEIDLTGKKVFVYLTYGSGKGKEKAMDNFCSLVQSKGGIVMGKIDIKGRQIKEEFEKFKEVVTQCLKQFQLIRHHGQ